MSKLYNIIFDIILTVAIVLCILKFISGGWMEILGTLIAGYNICEAIVTTYTDIALPIIAGLAYAAYQIILIEWENYKIWNTKDEISDWYNGY